jgi:hypothetical protein
MRYRSQMYTKSIAGIIHNNMVWIILLTEPGDKSDTEVL